MRRLYGDEMRMRAATRTCYAVMTIALVCGVSACGADPKAPLGTVKTLCSGTEQRCDGNALLTCADEGKSWTVGWCGESKACATTGGNVGCAGVKCERSSRSCDDKKVLACPADGLSEPTVVATCEAAEHCIFGECVTTACTAGDKKCGWKAALSCNGGSWESTKCAADERCDAATAACVARSCKPTEVKCATSKIAATCDATGSAWVDKACGDGKVCTDGICHREVEGQQVTVDAGPAVDAGGEVADTGGTGFIDAGKKDIPLEQFDILTITKSTTPTPGPDAEQIKFEFSSAGFSSVTKMLQITGDQGLNKLEIQIAPLEEFTTGGFTALEAQAEDSAIWMNDGSNDQATVQWQFQAVDYTVALTAFDDVGGRIKGTFSAKLGDAINKGKFIYVEGSFDIKRTN